MYCTNVIILLFDLGHFYICIGDASVTKSITVAVVVVLNP